METLTLNCWVRGTDVEELFTINISRTETVANLKKTIKNESPMTFRDVDARKIRLYKPRKPVPTPFEESLSKIVLSEHADLLKMALDELSQVFPEPPPPKHIHIIVDYTSAARTATQLTSAVPDITLNYWVRGDDMNRVCAIQISSTDIVEDLKKAIKRDNLPRFRDVTPNSLALYQVLLPYGEGPLEDLLDHRTISDLGKPLHGPTKLSAIFTPPPADNQLHLIVGGPVPLQCWVRGTDPGRLFGVKISMGVDLGALKNEIKATYGQAFDHLSPDRLKLYKIPTVDDVQLHEILDTLGSGQLLQGDESLGKVFDDVPFSRFPCVVVEVVDKTRIAAAVPSAVHPGLGYSRGWAARPPKSPSQQGEPLNFRALQSTSHRIEWARPFNSTLTTPVTLLHPILGQFSDDCRTHKPTSEDNRLALDLYFQMSKFFDSERQRQDAFINILHSHGIGIVRSSIADYQTDGDMHVNGRRYLLLEVKSEIGSKGAEPYCQAILYYVEATNDEVEQASAKAVLFNFPCLIITLFGAQLSFSGAAWTDRPNYQVLSLTMPLFWHLAGDPISEYTARCVGAFKKARQSLEELYKKLNETPADFKDLQPEFPHPRCYTVLDGENQVHFRYIRTLEASKLLFVVKTDAGEQLCVKFARTYDRTVHQQCAAWGISPSLRGFGTFPGGWHMAAMDFLEDYECLADVKHTLSREEKERLREELRSKLADLHQMNFVHGDVRDANVMVRKDRRGWKLVDFDWSGKIGEVRYPHNVNRGLGLWRPEGALDGELILADHDMEMLGYLF